MHADKDFPLGMILFHGQPPSTIGMFFLFKGVASERPDPLDPVLAI